jgi:hypothetical protein
MELFLDTVPEFLKEAAFASRVSEQAENWPMELNSELFKQLPFLSDYDVNVNLDRVDTGRGFAFGYADVSNKTERPEVEHTEMGIPHIRVPLIIIERSVKPFAIFLDGERVLPMTEERVRQILFNPASFDLSTAIPRDPSLVEPLMPPQRSGIGMGGEYKMASAVRPVPGHWEGNEGAADAIDFLSGRSKKSYADMDGKLSSEDDRHTSWIKQFEGTGLQAHAIELEKALLQHDIEGNRLSQADEAKRDADDEFRRRGDKIRNAKRGLELRLALHKLNGGGTEKEKISAAKLASIDISKLTPDQRKLLEEGLKKYVNEQHRKGRVVGAKKGEKSPFEKTSSTEELIKEAFKHISKEQWNAIYQSEGVKKAIEKYGTPTHPQVINKVYETAAKHYGFHPKVLDWTPEKPEMPAVPQPMKKSASLLMAIAPTIREKDASAFVEKLASDPYLVSGFRANGIAPLLIETLENTKTASAEERIMALAERIEPSVVTLQKLPGGQFLVKSANNNAFVPDDAAKGQVIPEQEAAEAVGPETAQQMQPGQTATAVADPVESVEPDEESTADVVDRFGQYEVEDQLGNSLLGHVFPQTLSWDGNFTPQPTALFTNGSAYAFQDAVAGELVGKGTTLPDDEPRGDGAFYSVEGGEAIATQPVTINSAVVGPDGQPKFAASDAFGNPLVLTQVEGLKQPVRIDGNEFAIPDSWKFMRLNNQTHVAGSSDEMSKVSAAKSAPTEVDLFYNGGFNVRGGCGLSKIARDFRYDLDPVGAEFVLGLLGVDGPTAKVKIAEARKKGCVKLAHLKTITLFGDRIQEAEKRASAFLERVPDLRRDLIKEAAAMDDEGTVDKILALNFINPENLETFINYLPELEKTAEDLAEMLLFSYLGMKELPEGAINRSMNALEEVITGLKGIAGSEV